MSETEPPYGAIAKLLKRGQVVPFLGAGVNFNMRPAGARWDEETSTFLPNAAELASALASEVSYPSTDEREIADLAKVSSYYAELLARIRLRETLRDVFNRNYLPTPLHAYLAQIKTPLLIITTNYDDLIEQAFRDAGRQYDLVVHPTDRSEFKAAVLWWPCGATKPTPVAPRDLYIDLKTTTVIYKMHGSVDKREGRWESYVISEDDYVDFLSRMTTQTAIPALFMNHMKTRHLLFLGYGLRDWNLRVVLKNLRTRLRPVPADPGTPPPTDTQSAPRPPADEDELHDLPSWAIQFDPSTSEKALWKSRNVEIFSQDIDVFVQKLKDW